MLWQKFSHANHISLLLVRYQGQLVASLILFKFKDRCSWEYLASDKNFNYLNTNYFGVWGAIKLAHSEGYKIFDFGRTGIHNKGLLDFKGRWGAQVVDLPHFFYPKKRHANFNYTEESIPYKILREINKNAPDTVYQFMGNFLYRHLG